MSKTVIVTGAGGQLGKALVQHLLDNGNTVVGTRSPNAESSLLATHPQYEEHAVDLSDTESTSNFVLKVVESHKKIDFAAMLAGGFAMGSIQDTSLDNIHHMFQLNFETAFNTAQAVFRQMQQQNSGGHLLFVGARTVLEPQKGSRSLAYALSKSLLFRLSEYINAGSAKHHVKASVIVPDTIDTPPNRASMPDADFTTWVKPEEIAEVIQFLLTDASSPLQQTILKVYGGN